MVISHLNIGALTQKLDDVRVIIEEYKIHILGLSETWIKKDAPNIIYAINGYTLIRCDRIVRDGGGLCIYLKQNIMFEILEVNIEFTKTELETLWILIEEQDAPKFILGFVYLHPAIKWEEAINELRNQVDELTGKYKGEVIIMGDTNCDLLKEKISGKSKFLINTLSEYKQLISKPTRIKQTIKGKTTTLIDHVFTNMPTRIITTEVIQPGVSDHHMTLITRKRKCPKLKREYKEVRQFNKMNPENFVKSIQKDLKRCDNSLNVNEMMDFFQSIIMKHLDIHAPKKRKYVVINNAPWINGNIKRLMHIRAIYKRKLNEGNEGNYQYYRDLYNKQRNLVTNEIRRNKKTYFYSRLKEAEKNNKSDAIWKTIRPYIKNNGKEKINEIRNGSSIYNSPLEIAETLNTHFINIVDTLIKNDDQNIEWTLNNENMINMRHTSEDEDLQDDESQDDHTIENKLMSLQGDRGGNLYHPQKDEK